MLRSSPIAPPEESPAGSAVESSGSADDLHQQIQSLQDRLRGSEACFEAILQSVHEGVLVVAGDGSIVTVNDRAEYFLGHRREELTGEMFGMPTAGDGTTEVNVVSADGLVCLVEMRHRDVRWDGQDATLITLQDITSHRSRAVTAESEVTKRDNFIAMLSHELRNPLAAIANSTQWMQMGRRDADDELALGVIGRQLNHLMRMLDDLLDVSRFARGKLQVQPVAVDLHRAVHDAISAAFDATNLNDRVLNLQLSDQPITVRADPVRLQQIICNLLTNAVRYSKTDDRIDLSVQSDDSWVQITVRDNGMGIEPEMLDNIFLPFVQTDQAIDRSVGGLGLGLALARQLIELHGGTIEAHSEGLGHGSRFCVTLPVLDPSQTPTPPEKNRGEVVRQRILLIEDSEDIRTTLRMLLQSDRHEVIERGDGPSGLQALIECRPDVAIVDIGLPGLTGYQIAEAAAMFDGRDQIRMVAATGYGRPEDRAKAFEAGFDDHITKPIDFKVLRDILLRTGAASSPAPSGAP